MGILGGTTKLCPKGSACQPLLGNTEGEGTCVADTVCWMNMGQFGCKVNEGKSGSDDGCFATKDACAAQYTATKCWMNMGQFGCKVNEGKSGLDDGCFASKFLCTKAYGR